jgi:Lrp/AsnC family leucine-responsive transcriptional regulator
VASPAALEDLLQQIRACASVSTRTTIVLSTPYENRPPDLGGVDASEILVADTDPRVALDGSED